MSAETSPEPDATSPERGSDDGEGQAANSTSSQDQSPAPAAEPPRWATIKQTARHLHVTDKTVRNYIGAGHFAAYEVPGVRGVLLDLHEVDRELAKIPRRIVKAPSAQSYGPNARIVRLPPTAIVVSKDLDI